MTITGRHEAETKISEASFEIIFTVKSLYDSVFLSPSVSPTTFRIDVPDSMTKSKIFSVNAELF